MQVSPNLLTTGPHSWLTALKYAVRHRCPHDESRSKRLAASSQDLTSLARPETFDVDKTEDFGQKG